MPANVHSLEAIEALRQALMLFVQQVEDALTELDSEMRRMMEWLERDRPRHWMNQLRLSMDQVHEAQQALNRCLMFPIADERPSCSEERAALKLANARQAYCETKTERVRHWQRTMEHELFEYRGRMSQLMRVIEVDVPQAIGILQKIIRRIEEYQSVRGADPQAAYNAVALVQDLWPASQSAESAPPDDDNHRDARHEKAESAGDGAASTASHNDVDSP